MTVYLIYKEDAWHSKGSGELLRVADNLEKCYATAEANGASEDQIRDLRAISGKVNVAEKITSLILKHGRLHNEIQSSYRGNVK